MSTDLPTVFLVRHGEVLNPDHVVYADLPGFSLSPAGRRQVGLVAERLPPNVVVVTSPLDRAVESAQILADVGNGRVVVDEALTEWGLLTRWAGHVWDSLDDVFPGELAAYHRHPDRLPFSPEPLSDLAGRVADAIERHRSVTSGPLVVVSHQDPIQASRLLLTHRSLADLNSDKPSHAGVVELTPRPTGPWFERAAWAPDRKATGPPSVAT